MKYNNDKELVFKSSYYPPRGYRSKYLPKPQEEYELIDQICQKIEQLIDEDTESMLK